MADRLDGRGRLEGDPTMGLEDAPTCSFNGKTSLIEKGIKEWLPDQSNFSKGFWHKKHSEYKKSGYMISIGMTRSLSPHF